VASDLRALVTALRMSADLERMGDLSHHIAKVARLRHPNSAIPNDLLLAFTEMGHVAEKLATKVATVITTRDTDMALQVEKDDDEMDELHKKVIAGIIGSNPVLSLDVAIDLTLLGRYYERFADHAVSVARRVYFLVKGEFAS
jgi:phosphate transport system protein